MSNFISKNRRIKAGVNYFTTEDGDQPRVRPFGTAYIFEGKLYIQTGKVKPISKQIANNLKNPCLIFMRIYEVCIMKTMIIRKWCISKMQ